MHSTTKPERPKSTLAVRGPLTQELFDSLGYDVPEVLGDPGICLPAFFSPEVEKTHRLGILSHVIDLPFWQEQKLPDGVKLVRLDQNVEATVHDILCCEATISSSLHGVIISNTYGIPTSWMAPVVGRLVGDNIKFFDYFKSVGMDLSLRDRKDLEFPLNVKDLLADVWTPPRDMQAMSERLLSVCPF